MKKKILSMLGIAILLVVMLFVLTGCGKKEEKSDKEEDKVSTTSKSEEDTENQLQDDVENTIENEEKTENKVDNEEKDNEKEEENMDEIDLNTFDFSGAADKQLAMPEKGETIAIMHVKGYGKIYMKFFEDVAPKAVENFITHAKEGYYDGLTFHRVINEFMIQGGDPEGTGMGGESIWGKGFGVELHPVLVPYRGSLCMAMSSLPDSIGSQFFITQANYDENMKSMLEYYGYPSKLLEEYKEHGGYLSLYLQYTVFGQVYQGLDVLDKIAAVSTDSNDKPLEDVIIEKIEITTY